MDGYALIEVNTEGEVRINEVGGSEGVHYFDFRLENLDLDHEFICDCIKPNLEGVKDSLVMVFFTYESVTSGCYWNVEYEDNIRYDSHKIVKTNYKEFYHMVVSAELEMDVYIPGSEYYKYLVSSWEAFYNEGFHTKE